MLYNDKNYGHEAFMNQKQKMPFIFCKDHQFKLIKDIKNQQTTNLNKNRVKANSQKS